MNTRRGEYSHRVQRDSSYVGNHHFSSYIFRGRIVGESSQKTGGHVKDFGSIQITLGNQRNLALTYREHPVLANIIRDSHIDSSARGLRSTWEREGAHQGLNLWGFLHDSQVELVYSQDREHPIRRSPRKHTFRWLELIHAFASITHEPSSTRITVEGTSEAISLGGVPFILRTICFVRAIRIIGESRAVHMKHRISPCNKVSHT